jgi:hypothetical protein
MRKKWVLSCLVLLATASAVFAQPQELTGNDILQNSVQAYARLDRYAGTSSVITRIAAQVSEAQTFDSSSTNFAKIEFNRSVESKVARVEDFDKKSRAARKPIEFSADAGKIKIEGAGTAMMPSGFINLRYKLISDGKTAETTIVSYDEKERSQKDVKVDVAVGGLNALSNGAATLVPAALLGMRYDNPLESLDSPHMEGFEKIGVWDCYKVTDFDPILNIKSTFWVDRQSFLLRQYQTERGEINLEAAKDKNARVRESLEETQQFMKKSGLKSITTLQMIGIEEAK